MSAETKFQVGDLVFAKMAGYPFWPARVENLPSDSKSTKYNVLFFGTYNFALTDVSSLKLYAENKEKLSKGSNTKSFKKAVDDIQNNPHMKIAQRVEQTEEKEIQGKENETTNSGKKLVKRIRDDSPERVMKEKRVVPQKKKKFVEEEEEEEIPMKIEFDAIAFRNSKVIKVHTSPAKWGKVELEVRKEEKPSSSTQQKGPQKGAAKMRAEVVTKMRAMPFVKEEKDAKKEDVPIKVEVDETSNSKDTKIQAPVKQLKEEKQEEKMTEEKKEEETKVNIDVPTPVDVTSKQKESKIDDDLLVPFTMKEAQEMVKTMKVPRTVVEKLKKLLQDKSK